MAVILNVELTNPSVFGEKGIIFATKFSKSGEWLLTASFDGTVCVWSVKNKMFHKQYRSHIGIFFVLVCLRFC